MNRKDYILIANALIESEKSIHWMFSKGKLRFCKITPQEEYFICNEYIKNFCSALKKENSNFDILKFNKYRIDIVE